MPTKLAGTKYTLGDDFRVDRSVVSVASLVSAGTFGAVGDGVTDDTAALQAAINAASPYGAVQFKVGATYRITSALTIGFSGVRLIGNGALIDGSAISAAAALDTTYAIKVEGTIGDAITLSSDVTEGLVSLVVTSTSTLTADDWILLYSTTEELPIGSGGTNLRGEMHRVRSVDSATGLTIYDGAFFAYTAASGGRVKRIAAVSGVRIEGLRVKMGGANKAHNGIRIRYAHNCVVEDCVVYDCEDTGVSVSYAYGCEVARNDIYNCTSPADGLSGVSGNTGYGVCAATATRNTRIVGNTIRNCRHAVAGGGTYPSIATLVQDNVVLGNRSAAYDASGALDCHEDCYYWVIDGNHVSASNASTGTQGILVRGQHTRVVNNVVTGSAAYGIYVRNYEDPSSSAGAIVENNVVTASRLGGIVVHGAATYPQSEIRVCGNTILSTLDDGIVLYGTTNAVVSGNVVKNLAGASRSGIRLVGTAATAGNQCVNVTIADNIIDTVTLHGIRVDYGDSITIVGNQVRAATRNGINAANCTELAIGPNKLATAGSIYSGIYLDACTKCGITGVIADNAATASGASSGVSINGASIDIAVTGCVFSGFVNGVLSVSPADYITAVGVNARNCTNGVVLTASANTASAGNL